MKTKKIIILHSNDTHGDFQVELAEADGRLVGCLPLLSGYINQVRRKRRTP